MNKIINENELINADDNLKKDTFSKNKALNIAEKLLFEIGNYDKSGIDFPISDDEEEALLAGIKPFLNENILANNNDVTSYGLPSLSEPETMRHYLRLSHLNYSIDTGIFPLGSCTMKHNPRVNEKIARLKGLSQIHPLQADESLKGAYNLMGKLGLLLLKITGMHSISLSPRAGAHGELAGLMSIAAAVKAKNSNAKTILIPQSAHGTNPATAAMLGFKVKPVEVNKHGLIDLEKVKEAIDDDVAGIMITNPNTAGVFESDISKISKVIHEHGGYVYCDGANLNAIMGKVYPADLGVDAMHLNLHKTFSTPHGGGGPGSGPVVYSKRLSPYAFYPQIIMSSDNEAEIILAEDETELMDNSIGRLSAYHGQFSTFVRALSYILAHGANGLKQVSHDAVLNANYIRAHLKDVMSLAFPNRTAMHEVLFNDEFLTGSGITTNDIAKTLIDEGFHPMTVYFPLITSGAMLIEPTETESKESLDQFINSLKNVALMAAKGDEYLKNRPKYAPLSQLDEVAAARNPILKYES